MDSSKTPISERVKVICESRFALDGSGCTHCPLKGACHSGPTANLTFERMEEWRLRLNAAAEQHQPPNSTIYRPCKLCKP